MDTRAAVLSAVGVAVAILIALGPQLQRYRASAAKEQAYTPNPANDTEIICAGWDAAELREDPGGLHPDVCRSPGRFGTIPN